MGILLCKGKKGRRLTGVVHDEGPARPNVYERSARQVTLVPPTPMTSGEEAG